MAEVLALCAVLQMHFKDWNLARVKCLAQLVLAMMMVKTVNLVQISTAFSGNAKQGSHYKRACRFMTNFTVPLDAVARFIVSLFPFGDLWYIAIDRTNWKLGQCSINVFVLSICYGGIAVPLLWKSLDKRANTKTQDRIDILNRFIHLFGVSKISSLLGDREFIGKRWIAFLVKHIIPFTIRVKCNHNIPNSRGILKPVKNFFRNLKPGEVRCLGQRNIMGSVVYIVGRRIDNNEWHIVITDSNPGQALQRYARRQEIETMFGCLKTRGFNFEDTHIILPERLDNLMAVMAIAFSWSYRSGDIFNEVEPIQIKSHGDRAKSIFRHGYDYLRRLMMNIRDRADEFFKNLELLLDGKKPHNALKNIMRA